MARNFCDVRLLLVAAAAAFIFIQIRLFSTQSQYADRLAAAVESESRCTSQMRLLIDQISTQQEKILSLEEAQKLQDEERAQLRGLVRDLERKGLQHLISKPEVPVAAVVIMACNRPDYLERTIESILKYQSAVASKFPLFVSQDGTNADVKAKVLTYSQITYMQDFVVIGFCYAYLPFIDKVGVVLFTCVTADELLHAHGFESGHLDFEPVHTERPGELIAYYKIARHYKWALDELFVKNNFRRVIILEDDMEISSDFFDYFEATAALLDKDKTIMAVSSWNDNGQVQFVHDPKTLYRSDFFPGLGWMLSKTIWDELSPKWPKAYWDDWVRLKEVHKDRQFIRPEICRTYNFGEHGSSMGQFFKQYLEPIKLNDVHVDWKSMDLTYLMELQDKYLSYFAKIVSDAKPAYGADAVLKAFNIDGDVRIRYNDQADFERIARQFGIFEEWKDGIPRTAYKGVVVFRHQTHRRIFLLGPDSLRQLGIEHA